MGLAREWVGRVVTLQLVRLGTGAALHIELATRALAELTAADAAGCAEGEAGPTCAEGTYLEAED